MKRGRYRAGGAGATGLHGHDSHSTDWLDAEAASAKMSAGEGPLAREFHRYLVDVLRIDTYDFGHKQPDERKPRFRSTTNRLNAWLAGDGSGGEPHCLTVSELERMLQGRQKLYCRPSDDARMVKLVVDIDAHDGEPDAQELASWVRRRYFPGAYGEPSDRGHHLHVFIHVGAKSPAEFNQLIADCACALQALARAKGFQAKLELKGNFALRDAAGRIMEGGRGHLGAVPRLKRGCRDFDRLISSPVIESDSLSAVVARAHRLHPTGLTCRTGNGPTATPSPTSVYLPKVNSDEPDAFKRMLRMGVQLEHQLRRPPTEAELMERYAQSFGPEKNKDRRGRAKDVSKYLARTLDPAKLPTSRGYAHQREELLRLVRAHVTDDVYKTKRKPSPGRKAKHDDYQDMLGHIRDEVFAVIVFTVELNSFKRQRRADRQWTNGNELFRRMFRKLRTAGLLERGVPGQTVFVAAKHLAEAAGLIECFDPRWRHGGGDDGICKKYHVGWRHPRHVEFLRFVEARDVKVTKVADLPEVQMEVV